MDGSARDLYRDVLRRDAGKRDADAIAVIHAADRSVVRRLVPGGARAPAIHEPIERVGELVQLIDRVPSHAISHHDLTHLLSLQSLFTDDRRRTPCVSSRRQTLVPTRT